ncbi:hypothetical protein [Croceimicrobium sp.]|uniref:hypothetical protein n=1 Tax=Croceimicrobium sp. TaxID=2828340 RepID=UPI003BAA5381
MKWYIHLIIGVACIPLYLTLGDVFKVAMAPYVLYLLFLRRVDYIIPLLFHFMLGSTISFFILMGTMVITLIHFSSLWKLKFNRIMLIFSGLLILLHGYNVMEQLRIGNNFVEILSSLAFPLSVFPFFWGQLLRGNLDTDFFKKLFIAIAIFVVIQLGLGEEATVRYLFFFIPFLLLSGIMFLRNYNGRLTFLDLLILVGFLMVGFVLGFVKGTIIFILAFALLLLFNKRVKLGARLLTKPRVLIIFVALFILSINQVETAGVSLRRDWEETSPFESLDSFLDYAKFKAIGDRSTLWLGGLKYLREDAKLSPPLEYPEISFDNIDGSEISDVSFGIHNLPLELIRSGGWISGLLVTFIFLRITFLNGRIINKYQMRKNDRISQLFLALVVLLFSSALIGGMVGQYLLIPSFSLLFMGLSGSLIIRSYDLIKQ